MPGSQLIFAEPLLHDKAPHSASCGVKSFTFVSLLFGMVAAVLLVWSPSSSDENSQHMAIENPTVALAGAWPTRFQPRTATSNRFLSSPWQIPSASFQPPRIEAKAQLLENTWQARLDKALLNVDVEPRERLSLLQEALTDPVLPNDLRSAVGIIQEKGFGKGHPEFIEKLWPKGTTARADLEGLTALRKQVPEVLQGVPEALQGAVGDLQQSPTSFFPPTNSAGAATLPDLASLFGSIQTLVSDTEKQKEILEETKDLLRSTPKGLETPEYKVVRTIDGPLFLGVPEPIELRGYENFTVARTTMPGAGFTSRTGATGFNTLASYLFGKNDANQGMKMTMPVIQSSGAMAFVLPKQDAEKPPAPLANASITIDKVPARLVAAKPFPGIVTDEEVQRQKVALLESIAADGSITPVDESQVIVLQYNSPLTVPWRRRNEVAMVVTEKAAPIKEETEQGGAEVAEKSTLERFPPTAQNDIESKAQQEVVVPEVDGTPAPSQ